MISDNHSGIVWSLMALIIVTLAGVFLSLLVDKRLSFSHSRNALARQISENDAIQEALRGELAVKSEKLANFHSQAERADGKIREGGESLATLREAVATLRKKKATLPAAIRETENSFSGYRVKYRQAAWADAVGERMDSLFLKDGRHFERVIISRVTPLGLEISHSRGSARIDSADLGNQLRDRFQWDEKQREAFLAKERPAPAEPEETVAVAVADAPAAEGRDEAAIAALRREMSLWNAKLSSLRAEYAVAVSHDSRRSVPGSLRTWGEKAGMLRAEIARAEAGLAVAVGKLRTLSPNDPVFALPR